MKCTFVRLSRELAKAVFGCRTLEALRQFVGGLEPTTAPMLETGAEALELHRLLTGDSLEATAGEFPLNHAVLGGRSLANEQDLQVVLKRPDMVPHIAESLQAVYTDRGLANPSELLPALTKFYQEAAKAGDAVLFIGHGVMGGTP